HQTKHIVSLSRIEEDKYVWLDRFTIRNLELFNSINEGAKTLVQVIDKTISPMGARLLKRWIALPLKEISAINNRLNVVEFLVKDESLKENLEEHIRQVGDLERIISKVAVVRINPREVVQLKNALQAIVPIKQMCGQSDSPNLQRFAEQLNPCESIRQRIEKEIHPDPPTLVNKGSVIAAGVSPELDELRLLAFSGKDYLAKMQERESERTGITSLKIAFNNVFGYYIEVRNTHKDKVPPEWIRKQTLVGAERYITEELKEYESKILGAEEKILAIEVRLFNELVVALAEYIQAIQLNASIVGQLDCLLSFATTAIEFKYSRPEINDSKDIIITGGRHPVIEHQLPMGESYISNNVTLNQDDQQVIIITGPNMAGKSALLRQTALIVLMAQIGSFVPADAAQIGYV
ncbi:MAG: DNA mismatch repair protein MutS, partial [Bacteroidota bacterium]|nr:DNA mismatch repair protein MutS [Bacteroidota bacterium]